MDITWKNQCVIWCEILHVFLFFHGNLFLAIPRTAFHGKTEKAVEHLAKSVISFFQLLIRNL
ncbi:hypothetical protein LguiA_003021 [Lonicera macranthoides]